ncbi:DnaJ domain-containing protein [Colletotrichum sublineola]|nr:DnaJ domain-containing protein [Colletotrichum sublineola]
MAALGRLRLLRSASQAFLRSYRCYSHSHGQRPKSCSTSQPHDRTLWPQTPCPSPHDILGAEPGQTYSKKQFHRLVKLYHPDLHSLNEDALDAIPRATRTERYRLVVEAHEILSNPQKRFMYERYGLGWVLPRRENKPYSYQAAGVHGTKDSRPSGHAGSRQQIPIFASNATIAIILVAVAMAGAIVQLERARKVQRDFKEQDKALQDSISRDLQELADQLEGKPRDMRILEFLARRELCRWKTGEVATLGFDPGEDICHH